ncbi:hypothetical protein [Streptomyces sp. NPDC059008]|uniref:hypothetical protein n=1 Tax=Streptomyces sp. NPDC059008 TaxID=3346693 RepID=UPI0036C6907F
MTRRTTSHLPVQDAELGTTPPFHPRLGDLARDTARKGRVGVVVARPGEGVTTYHLRPPGGGKEWSAPADGTTLKPVPSQVTHVTPHRRDVVYDHRTQQGALPVRVHFDDGGTSEAVLILSPGHLELYACQVERIIELRKAHGETS